MTEENTEVIDAIVNLLKVILSKKGLAGGTLVILAMVSGGSFIGQYGAAFVQPTNVQVSAPEVEAAVDKSLAPVQEMIEDHTLEPGHSKSILAIDRLQTNLQGIEKSVQRQEAAIAKTADSLAETAEGLNRLTGQVEILVKRMP